MNPKETHITSIKSIFWYLKGTKDYGLWYKKEGGFKIRVYTAVDRVQNVDERNNRSVEYFFLGERFIT